MPTRPKISVKIRAQVANWARHRCSYCRSPEWLGIPMVVDHIVPLAAGGSSALDNLCLACYRCNEFKGAHHMVTEPLSGMISPLFHPRRQLWAEHFAWGNGGERIIGLTSIGRATIVMLRLNNDWIIRARRIWIQSGWHPPVDE